MSVSTRPFLFTLIIGLLGTCLTTLSAEEPEVTAKEGPLAGHSYHGETFNEGPRQAAYLMSGVSDVKFPATCKSEQVQKFINQGLGQFHGFWFFEAERSFRQAAALDPDCAIAYWGMAMANMSNKERARGFIAEADKRKEKVTKRERMYIEALAAYLKEDKPKDKEQDEKEKAEQKEEDKEKEREEEKKRRQTLVKAYEKIIHEFPDDLEAKALLCLQIYGNRSKGIPISSYYAVDALLNSILAENPLHPCHHFRIHLWDYERAENALNSAAKCGASAPAIAHMWHMPGHIYSRLHRYHDAVWQQEASARTDHAYMMRDRVMPDQIHNFAHNNEWLISNLIHIGDADAALDLAKNMIDLPRHPKYNTLKKRSSSKYGRMRLIGTLYAFHMWPTVMELSQTRYLEPTDLPEEQIKRDVLVATAKFQTGDVLGGSDTLTQLKKKLSTLKEEQQAAGDKAQEKAKSEKKDEKAQKAAADKAKRSFGSKIRPVEAAVNQLEGFLHLAHEAYQDAATSLGKVSAFDKSWLARIHQLAGDEKKALELIKKEVEKNENETVPLVWQTLILWEAGKKEEARKSFEQLRELSSAITLDAPLFAQLAPVAKDLGFEADWRIPRSIPEDFGERPELDELGPFRWSPSPAEDFALKDVAGKVHSLQDYQGKPVVVIFYLGYGCLHCAEQLQAFAPMTEKFEKAGISLIAISTDTPVDLKMSHENYGEETFPFPLVSNSDLDIFKRYRCFDDFEEQTLHGTFLIDADGLVRWQDISYEPFMEADFLLKESQRLLNQKQDWSTEADIKVTTTP